MRIHVLVSRFMTMTAVLGVLASCSKPKMSDDFLVQARRTLIEIQGETGSLSTNAVGDKTLPKPSSDKLADLLVVAKTDEEKAVVQLLTAFQLERTTDNAYRSRRLELNREAYRIMAILHQQEKQLNSQGLRLGPSSTEMQALQLIDDGLRLSNEMLRVAGVNNSRMSAKPTSIKEGLNLLHQNLSLVKKRAANVPVSQQRQFETQQLELQKIENSLTREVKIMNGELTDADVLHELQPEWVKIQMREEGCASTIEKILLTRTKGSGTPLDCVVQPEVEKLLAESRTVTQ